MLIQYKKKQIDIEQIYEYLRTSSPSKIELDILNLTDYEFDLDTSIDYVSNFVHNIVG